MLMFKTASKFTLHHSISENESSPLPDTVLAFHAAPFHAMIHSRLRVAGRLTRIVNH